MYDITQTLYLPACKRMERAEHTNPVCNTQLSLIKHAGRNNNDKIKQNPAWTVNHSPNLKHDLRPNAAVPAIIQYARYQQASSEPESMSKASFKPKESVQTTKSLKRRYNGRVQRGVFVHSAVNAAAPGISIHPPSLLIHSHSTALQTYSMH